MNTSADAGLSWRPLTAADMPALTSLAAVCLSADGGLPFAAEPGFFRPRYLPEGLGVTLGAQVPTVGLVAAAAVSVEEHKAIIVGQVHPAWRRRGIGAELLRWSISQATALLAPYPLTAREVLIATESLTEAADRLYRRYNFAQNFAEEVLRCDLHDPRPDTPLPAGIALTTWRPELAGAFFEAYRTSFRDRPGFKETNEADWVAWATDDEDFLPEMSLLAFAGELPAGFTICDVDWVAQMGVRPEWRGRGLGAALLGQALRRFHEAGSTGVALGVNVNNATARRLYGRMGFAQIGCRARYAWQNQS